MPHIFFLILIIVGIVYGVFKFFLYIVNSLFLIDERFVEKIKNSNIEHLNFFIDNPIESSEELNEKEKIKNEKIKIVNRALRFDFIICTIISILWFFYPFMLLQLTPSEIIKISPSDKYIGKWIAIILLASNIFSFRFIKNGKLFSKQYILLIKLLCACLVIITTILIVINTNTLYMSNIISIFLTAIWLSNSAVGLFLSHEKK